MTLKRVIFTFENGARRYATHNGEILKWEEGELDALAENIKQHGYPVCTSDFMQWDVDYKSLRHRLPYAKILRVTNVEYESAYHAPQQDIDF
jgi:hypothetical protein